MTLVTAAITLFICSNLFQIWRLYKVKSGRDISIILHINLIIGYTMLLYHGIEAGEKGLIAQNSCNIVMIGWTLWLVVWYRIKDGRKNNG